MNARKTRFLLWSGVLVVCIIALAGCRRSGEVGRAAAEKAPPWTLSVAAPIDHLDMVAREPMIVEHPNGTLFVSGYGAAFMSGKRRDEATLWKSRDGGTTWTRVNVGTEAEGAAGNSDVDLAVARDGTLYFATLIFDGEKEEGKQISIGVSKDVGMTWKWTLLSKTRFDDRPWVKVAPDGTAHVIWNDGRGVCHAVSQDCGRTWTERARIHPKGGSSQLAVGPNGEVAVRVTPTSAAGPKYDEGVDLIAVSTDGGTTWRKQAAPGYREWNPDYFPVPRWVEPLAWDARGALYSLWTNLKGVWLARSVDRGATWTTWQLKECPEVAYFPYLVAGGPGELAATWFSGWTGTWQAQVARIDVSEGGAPPRMVESPPIKPDSWRQNLTWPEDPPIRDTAGEYLAVSFLRTGGLVVVSPIQNKGKNRYGFSLWKVEERRGESKDARAEEWALATRVEHFFVVSDQAQSLFTYFKDEFRLPEVWPFYEHGTFASGGLSLGNVVLEFVSFPKADNKPLKTEFGGIAFEPKADADATAAELARRNIPHTDVRSYKSQIPGRQILAEWSSVALTGLPPTNADIFFCDYKDRQAVAQGRRAASHELAIRMGGPLGIVAVADIALDVRDLKEAGNKWSALLQPSPQISDDAFVFYTGPQIRLVHAGAPGIQGIVLSVRSIGEAEKFLRERRLLAKDDAGHIAISPAAIDGLRIRLVQK